MVMLEQGLRIHTTPLKHMHSFNQASMELLGYDISSRIQCINLKGLLSQPMPPSKNLKNAQEDSSSSLQPLPKQFR